MTLDDELSNLVRSGMIWCEQAHCPHSLRALTFLSPPLDGIYTVSGVTKLDYQKFHESLLSLLKPVLGRTLLAVVT